MMEAVEGASAGAGLGHEFLRHVERTTVLVHLLDVAPADGTDPVANYRAIRAELGEYSRVLADKPEIIALNKIDLVPPDERADTVELFAEALKTDGFHVTSGATREGVPELLEACWQAVGKDRNKPGWANGT